MRSTNMTLKSSLCGMLIAAAGMSVLPVTAVAASDGKAPPRNTAYIVQLAEQPVAAYAGGISGYAATKPRKGQKINPNDPQVYRYMGYLAARQDSLLSGVGGGKKLYNYGYVFNGFAAELTDAQAMKLALTPGVLAVSKDEIRQMDTASTPTFLGLTGTEGFWATKATGENVIIGIVDSGAWPEHPSLSDRTGENGNGTKDGKLGYQQIPGWNGKCQPGEAFTGTDCNQKLIGARYYNAGFGGNAGIDTLFPFEFNSPRDWDGHGTHTATTAGGNANVQVTGPAAVLGKISGIAPRARIAAYKVCWADAATGGGCAGSDSVAAIDQAVADGVDVINFSISGTSTNFRDPVEIAFLFAADAGVFVAASAGNAGPTTATVAHPSPWLTTVAAGTHNRSLLATVVMGNGASYTGASSAATTVANKPLIDSIAAGLPGASATAVSLCFSASWNGGAAALDPALVAGKIVVCDRGVNDRVDKSLAVREAGGLGMVLLNPSANSLVSDFHSVPTVHLADTVRAAVKAYAATAGATATINAAVVDFATAAPFTASFSSRGPLRGASGDLLKPDLIAPGQDILAGVSPVTTGRLFDLLSGTSMSSPHVAGLAALFKELRPGWSPMAIKSALMTTGTDVLDGGTPPAAETIPGLIFRQGAGHVNPSRATDPGLVFDSNFADWLAFICGVQPGGGCTGVTPIDASNLNVASIAIGDMAGVQTVTRRVTNVGTNPATYAASVNGMAGFTVAVSPSSLSLAVGETKSFTVSFTRTTAALNAYAGGQLRLADGAGHTVRVPMVVRPVALAAPAEVSGSYNVTFGFSGAFSATARGLVPATVANGAVATGGVVDIPVVVPAGMTYARFATFDSEVSQPSDLDLEVYLNGALVGSSGGATTAEAVNLLNPAAGTYTVRVVGFAVPTGAANFKLFSWALGSTAAGNMTVTAPTTASTGLTSAIGIATSGLSAGTKYLGSVVYGGPAGLPNPTIVRVDP